MKLSSEAVTDSQHLSGYCDDSRVNALAVPAFTWNLTGGPRYNAYGVLVGYSGEAAVKLDFFVFDCFGIPFFAEQKTKTENRYFVHRQPDREVVDMANDLLDQVTADFSVAKTQRAAVWHNLLKTGLSIDPFDDVSLLDACLISGSVRDDNHDLISFGLFHKVHHRMKALIGWINR